MFLLFLPVLSLCFAFTLGHMPVNVEGMKQIDEQLLPRRSWINEGHGFFRGSLMVKEWHKFRGYHYLPTRDLFKQDMIEQYDMKNRATTELVVKEGCYLEPTAICRTVQEGAEGWEEKEECYTTYLDDVARSFFPIDMEPQSTGDAQSTYNSYWLDQDRRLRTMLREDPGVKLFQCNLRRCDIHYNMTEYVPSLNFNGPPDDPVPISQMSVSPIVNMTCKRDCHATQPDDKLTGYSCGPVKVCTGGQIVCIHEWYFDTAIPNKPRLPKIPDPHNGKYGIHVKRGVYQCLDKVQGSDTK